MKTLLFTILYALLLSLTPLLISSVLLAQGIGSIQLQNCQPEEKVLSVGYANLNVSQSTGVVFASKRRGALDVTYRSLNNGEIGSWTVFGAFRNSYSSAADPLLLAFLAVTADDSRPGSGGRYRSKICFSRDGGYTLDKNCAVIPNDVVHIHLDIFQRQRVYAFGLYNSLVYLSEDGGRTFGPGRPYWNPNGRFSGTNSYDPNTLIYTQQRPIWGVTQDPLSPDTFYLVSEDYAHTGYGFHPDGWYRGTNPEAFRGSWEDARKFLLIQTNNRWQTSFSAVPPEINWHASSVLAYENTSTGQTDLFYGLEGNTAWIRDGATGVWSSHNSVSPNQIENNLPYQDVQMVSRIHSGEVYSGMIVEEPVTPNFPDMCRSLRIGADGRAEIDDRHMSLAVRFPYSYDPIDNGWREVVGKDMPAVTSFAYDRRNDILYFATGNSLNLNLTSRDSDNLVFRVLGFRNYVRQLIPTTVPTRPRLEISSQTGIRWTNTSATSVDFYEVLFIPYGFDAQPRSVPLKEKYFAASGAPGRTVYKVRACNLAGCGGYSNEVEIVQ